MKNEHDAPYVSPRRTDVKKRPNSASPLGRLIAFLLVASAAFLVGALSVKLSTGTLLPGGDIDLSSVQSTYAQLKEKFDGELDTQALIDGANKGLVEAAGDDYTTYLTAGETAEYSKSLNGDIGGGIGVEVGMRNKVPVVERVLQDNPAEKAGVMQGDIITAVNGEDTEGKTLNEVVALIRGEPDTTVLLQLFRSGQQQEVTITRQKVNNPSAYGSIKDGVGVLTISRFDNQTGSLARSVAREFKDAGVKSVVLDLRGNGGGYVTAAKEVAGIWLDGKVVVSERRGAQVVEELKTSTGSAVLAGVPTVVLVNQSSASASEIVAGALRDHKVAKLVGLTTFGKGSVQQLLELPHGSTLKVTVARWYTPSGHNISEEGLKPDVEIPARTVEDVNAGRDPQLEKAQALSLGQ